MDMCTVCFIISRWFWGWNSCTGELGCRKGLTVLYWCCLSEFACDCWVEVKGLVWCREINIDGFLGGSSWDYRSGGGKICTCM